MQCRGTQCEARAGHTRRKARMARGTGRVQCDCTRREVHRRTTRGAWARGMHTVRGGSGATVRDMRCRSTWPEAQGCAVRGESDRSITE
jgi:hypothetical protein